MRCPDCGYTLTPVPLGVNGEANQSFRCYRCGGFWIEGWLVNRLNSKILDKWPQNSVMHSRADGGNQECPIHIGTKLDRYIGESVPQHLVVSRCPICNWWWFPENTLFRYKPAQEAKVNYYKAWGMPADLKGLLLPVLVLVVLLSGGVVALKLIKQQQYAFLQASGVVSNFTATNLGDGEAIVAFKSSVSLSDIEYKIQEDIKWIRVPVVEENGLYTLRMSSLQPGIYQFRILGKIYPVEIK